MNANTHSSIREDIRRRIVAGEWALGEQMPGEIDLASEYDCSRTTMNRALRALADEGMIERKRKGGTRVRPLPVHQAQLQIPLVREQVENRRQTYSHRVVKRTMRQPPVAIRARLELGDSDRASFLETLHLADGAPFAFESRWVNLAAVPDFQEARLDELSANEWLVREIPFTNGEVGLSATRANAALAEALGEDEGAALFTLERTTWLDGTAVTTVTFYYTSGFRLEFPI
ncbi:UTRA domain-containing protein [Altererythrobacter arenosus]|uniref:UTRA domain-containing protein n=1 Tax=Altererythrobacter arenosus TaxID=3032592 RepID=A0ABY8FN06_9SPHN|nr:UTRA domain-containing protein [Altererythrobacter sp. CAU 1644]WFL76407.1 UTRA domain-containing protein [Altererythrobacter sp. CAU 1644]